MECLLQEMREIVLDTETTGLRPSDGHRVIEIAAIEIIDFLPTGKTYQQYICLLYTSPSPRDEQSSRMPSSA